MKREALPMMSTYFNSESPEGDYKKHDAHLRFSKQDAGSEAAEEQAQHKVLFNKKSFEQNLLLLAWSLKYGSVL